MGDTKAFMFFNPFIDQEWKEEEKEIFSIVLDVNCICLLTPLIVIALHVAALSTAVWMFNSNC